MKTKDDLKSKRGASLAEFLICAPLLVLLALGAYDLNKRMEDQQTVAILARNAGYLGAGIGADRQAERTKANMIDERRILDTEERDALSAISQNSADHGINISNADHVPSNDEETLVKGRMSTPTGVQTVSKDSVGSTYDSISSGMGTVTGVSTTVLQPILSFGETMKVFIPSGLRVTGVETSAPGSTNAMQRGLGVVAAAIQTEDADAEAGPSYKAEIERDRRFAGRSYLHPEAGYHPNNYRQSSYVGIVAGLPRSQWGAGGDFSDSASSVQSRCMTRLAGSNNCGTSGLFRDRDFLSRIRHIATAKFALSTALKIASAVPPAAPIAITEEIATLAFKQAVFMAVDEAANRISEAGVQALTSNLPTPSLDFDQGIQGVQQNILRSITPNLDSGTLSGVLTEGGSRAP